VIANIEVVAFYLEPLTTSAEAPKMLIEALSAQPATLQMVTLYP
jgi:hypothetical protein